MIKLVRPTVRSSHVCHLTTCPSPTTWQMLRCLPPCRPSVRPYARLAVAALVSVCRLSAGRPRCPHLPSTARRPFTSTRSLLRFPPRCSCYRLSVVPMVSRRRQRRPPKYVLFYENAAASSLDRIRMKSVHRVLQPSVTVEINFFCFLFSVRVEF